MKNFCVSRGAALLFALFIAGCGGGGGGAPSVSVSVQVSWNANREAAVNRPGGGYRVYHSRSSGFDIATASFVDVPYSSGATAPTTASLTLSSGDNFIRVVAYSDLNPNGSDPSGEITVTVPFGAAP
jgi:hypothetical protein